METEVFAFQPKKFPRKFCNHRLVLLNNKGYITIDGRLSFHLTIHCTKCKNEETIRGRLPPEQSDEEKMAYAKLAALGAFNNQCTTHRKIYKSSSSNP